MMDRRQIGLASEQSIYPLCFAWLLRESRASGTGFPSGAWEPVNPVKSVFLANTHVPYRAQPILSVGTDEQLIAWRVASGDFSGD